MKFTTETLDKAYLEYSNLTDAVTRKEIEQQEEISRLTIAYQNASDQRQHYVDKCLMLSKVVLDLVYACSAAVHWCGCECDSSVGYICIGCNVDKDLTKHKDLIDELERNLEVKSE